MERLDCDRMFIAVKELGSFTKAAKRMGTSSGQASKMISRLENELGVQLFKRSTRAVTPTQVGESYYQRIKAIIDELDALNDSIRTASNQPSGRLRISAPVSFGRDHLMPQLLAFAERYPLISLDVSFADRPVSIVDEGFDLAFRIGALRDSSLVARKLCDVRVVTVASEKYLSAAPSLKHWRELSTQQCIIDTNFVNPYQWPYLTKARGKSITDVSVDGRLKFSNAEACLQAAVEGLGVARLPTFVAGKALQNSQLHTVLDQFETPPLGLFALYPPSKHLPQTARAVIDFLVSAFAGEPLWDQGW